MPPKTHVDGNRVTIEGLVYELRPAGAAQHAIYDEFGEHLGYFTVKGKTIVPDDYRLAGAPPVAKIARVWLEAQESADPNAVPATKGICLIATHEALSDAALAGARAYRVWLKSQPGMKASYLVRDPASGKTMSIAIWQSQRHLDAAKAAAVPSGAVEPAATSVETLPMVEEP